MPDHEIPKSFIGLAREEKDGCLEEDLKYFNSISRFFVSKHKIFKNKKKISKHKIFKKKISSIEFSI
jgi:hypothetical protein